MIKFGKPMLIAALVSAVYAAGAQVIVYNNLGNPPSWDTSGGWTISGLNDGQTIYMPFTPSASGAISEVDAAVDFQTTNPAGGMYANLVSSIGGAPGAVLDTSGIRNDPNTNGLDGFVFGGTVNITAGQQYFIQLTTTSVNDANGFWYYAKGDPQTTFYFTENGGAPASFTGNDSAFRVFVSQSVPEPSAIATFGIGLLGLVALKRRK